MVIELHTVGRMAVDTVEEKGAAVARPIAVGIAGEEEGAALALISTRPTAQQALRRTLLTLLVPIVARWSHPLSLDPNGARLSY